MKAFLLLTWLGIAGAGYYGYNFYQQTLANAQKSTLTLDAANASNADLTSKVEALTKQISTLQALFSERKNAPATLQAETTTAPPTTTGPTITSTSIPSTISTLSGRTYTGCILSRATPDGISFTHSMGVAKVPFSDLDPTFAKTFGYDPTTAKKYEQDQALAAAQSDASRTTAEAAAAAQVATQAESPVQASTPVSAPAGLSPEAKASIQSQITSLQSDVSFMQAEEAKVVQGGNSQRVRSDGREVNQGAYAQKILDEKAQITQLQAELR